MIPQSVYFNYLNSLMEGNKADCTKIVSQLIQDDVPVKEIYDEIFQKTMYRIGHLWENNRTTVATEHLASQITESLLSLVYPKILEQEKIGKTAIIACVDKEFHEIGPRIVSDFFELHGWHSYFLGSNTPRNDVIETIREKQPDVVGISNNFYINFVRLIKLVDDIKRLFPEQEIILGGQALNENIIESLDKYNNIKLLKSLDELEEYIKSK